MAVAGAFLLDAETRLNPSLASAYFGAGRGEHHSPAARSVTTRSSGRAGRRACGPGGRGPGACSAAEDLPGDRTSRWARWERPLARLRKGKVVFLCCDGCEGKFDARSREVPGEAPKPDLVDRDLDLLGAGRRTTIAA